MQEMLRDIGWIRELGKSLEEENGNPLQYSCLENLMDRGARQATLHGVTKIWTLLKQFNTHTLFLFSGLIFLHVIHYL